jgi:hypothetical protein
MLWQIFVDQKTRVDMLSATANGPLVTSECLPKVNLWMRQNTIHLPLLTQVYGHMV